MNPAVALILCRDGHFSRLLENELALIGLETMVVEDPTQTEDADASLVLLDGDAFPPDAADRWTGVRGCPLLLFSRTPMASLPAGCLCLHRPFGLEELQATVRRLMGKTAADGPSVDVRYVRSDPQDHSRDEGAYAASLSPTERRMLEYLCAHKGELVSREELSALVGGGGNSVDVYMCHLRAKIEKPLARRLITTVRGKGYRLEE